MNDLFFALWKRQISTGKARPEGPGACVARLLAAAVAIGVGAWLLDHAAAIEGKAGTLVTASRGSSQEGSWK